jgi:hypothetical protein
VIRGRIAIPDKDPKTWRSRDRKRKPAQDVPVILDKLRSVQEIERAKRRAKLKRGCPSRRRYPPPAASKSADDRLDLILAPPALHRSAASLGDVVQVLPSNFPGIVASITAKSHYVVIGAGLLNKSVGWYFSRRNDQQLHRGT